MNFWIFLSLIVAFAFGCAGDVSNENADDQSSAIIANAGQLLLKQGVQLGGLYDSEMHALMGIIDRATGLLDSQDSSSHTALNGLARELGAWVGRDANFNLMLLDTMRFTLGSGRIYEQSASLEAIGRYALNRFKGLAKDDQRLGQVLETLRTDEVFEFRIPAQPGRVRTLFSDDVAKIERVWNMFRTDFSSSYIEGFRQPRK